jgi:orotidine-5'-phosphate decarboxylase
VTFGQRLASFLQQHGPLCVGVDPSPALLDAWGLPYSAAGLDRFGATVIDAMGGRAAVLKPQVAFWEAHGSAGYAALERFIALARDRGFLVLADAKRGDIGSTSEAYARAWLDPSSPLCVDAVTVTAYLGLAALDPFLSVASEHGKGVIVVARSSNHEGTIVQSAATANGATVADHLLAEIAALNERAGHAPYGGVGAVVGGTTAAGGFDVARLGGPILAPGFGAQGATADDFPRLYGTCPPGTVLASVSRDILRAGPDPERLGEAAATWQRDLRAAAGHWPTLTPVFQ